jgi:hypothetical protein
VKLGPLLGIEVVAFLLIIGETYLFFNVVVPLGSIPHDFLEYTGLALAKLVLTFGLGVFWFLVMIAMTRLYTRSKLSPHSPTSSS